MSRHDRYVPPKQKDRPPSLREALIMAREEAGNSIARRLKVGCIIWNDSNWFSLGHNSMPFGFDPTCEPNDLKSSYPQVIHAEANALDRMIRYGISSMDATVVITHAPCFECAKRLYGAEIRKVYYESEYRSNDGIEFLRKVGIACHQIKDGHDHTSNANVRGYR